jgi:prepilin-type N-terminal cleavage/methylation domain-containing protein
MRYAFTLIELMIVIAIIAVIAAIAIPNLMESRVTANEAQAGASFKTGLFPAQAQFQAGGYVDVDGDGLGCYAENLEFLAGTVGAGTLGVGPMQSLSLLQPAWRFPDDTAIGGYCYRADTDLVTENNAERNWAGYGAPATFGDVGRRFYAMTAAGVVYCNLGSVDMSAATLDTISWPGGVQGADAAFTTDPVLTTSVNSGSFVVFQK